MYVKWSPRKRENSVSVTRENFMRRWQVRLRLCENIKRGKIGCQCKARENLFIQCQVWGEEFIAQFLIAIEDLQSDLELLTDFSWPSKHFLGIAESINEMHQWTRKGPFLSFNVSWRKFAMSFFYFFGEMIFNKNSSAQEATLSSPVSYISPSL